MSNGARREPQEIRIDLAVLPETNCQGLFYHFSKNSPATKCYRAVFFEINIPLFMHL